MEEKNRNMDPEWKKNAKKLDAETAATLPKELLEKISGGRGDLVPYGDEYYEEIDTRCPFCCTKLWKLYTRYGEYEYTICHMCGYCKD